MCSMKTHNLLNSTYLHSLGTAASKTIAPFTDYNSSGTQVYSNMLSFVGST